MIIGEARVSRQGLYYDIRCACKCCGDSAVRAVVQCGDQKADLGILVPEGNVYAASTRIAVSKLGTGFFRFFVQSKHGTEQQPLVPIKPEEPFAYISQLENIRLQKENGRLYAQIQEVRN